MRKTFWSTRLLLGLCVFGLGTFSGQVLAQGGPGGGGSGSGGGSGGSGGGGGTIVTTVSLALSGPAVNGIVPQGKGQITISGQGGNPEANRALSIQVARYNMPNGTPLSIWVAADVPVSGGQYTVVWQYAGTMLVNSGSAALSIDTTRGNAVPLFHGIGLVWVINAPPPGPNTPPPTVDGIVVAGGYLDGNYQLSSNANSP